MSIRKNVYAGQFYPQNPQVLHQMILSLSISSDDNCSSYSLPSSINPKMAVVPHAGYVFSGMVSAGAYKGFSLNKDIRRVLIIGPSHRVGFYNFGLTTAESFETSLGPIQVDNELQEELQTLGKEYAGDLFSYQDEAHGVEHSIEVQLPFLKSLTGVKSFVPILSGFETDYMSLAGVISDLLAKHDDLGVLISTDLSHFLSYDYAVQKDKESIEKIKNLEDGLGGEDACGNVGVNLGVKVAQKMGYDFYYMCYFNSGDITGSTDEVVGYLGGVFG